ncbi:unnamed protein product [Ceratitis capitata]|uniref:(Mediterranean fruit fly) hypothetical protein n=1 Tax=Ceratitis capitata TaxID=7213 RepID=A0A811V361_CERCA|nr:unnamed protein product [Ceratitis capitata]
MNTFLLLLCAVDRLPVRGDKLPCLVTYQLVDDTKHNELTNVLEIILCIPLKFGLLLPVFQPARPYCDSFHSAYCPQMPILTPQRKNITFMCLAGKQKLAIRRMLPLF